MPKPSTRSSNKSQRFDKNHNRVEVEEGTLITQNEEVNSTAGRTDTILFGTDEVDNSDLDDQLISTSFKNIDDDDSGNNSGRDEEHNDNEEEDGEEAVPGG